MNKHNSLTKGIFNFWALKFGCPYRYIGGTKTPLDTSAADPSFYVIINPISIKFCTKTINKKQGFENSITPLQN